MSVGRVRFEISSALALSALLAACSETPTAVATQSASTKPSASLATDSTAETLDDRFAALAHEIPGFGGVFLDSARNPVVYLTDMQRQDLATSRLASFLRQTNGANGSLRFRLARYDFAQLRQWYRSLQDILNDPDVVFTDIDEGENGIRVGVSSTLAIARVQKLLIERGIPDRALVVEQVPPVKLTASLQDQLRPIPGGMQIQFIANPFIVTCTIGFNVMYQGNPAFVTASHCTMTQGGVESTQYYQSTQTNSPVIATEVADPVYFTGGACPSGRRCRYSDAAVAKYATATLASFPEIAIPLNSTNPLTPTPLQIEGMSPVITVDDVDTQLEGFHLSKIGRTTGSTSGTVSSTCVNVNVNVDLFGHATNITQLCQSIVNGNGNGSLPFSGDGDSGGPVEVAAFDLGTNQFGIGLYGILWGSQDAHHYIFSPLSGVERDIGPLTYH